jgi:hypothetical protein
MINSDFAQHTRNNTVLFCPGMSTCVRHAEALLFRIDASQEPISRSRPSITTRRAQLVQIQYRPPVISLPCKEFLEAAGPPCYHRALPVGPQYPAARPVLTRWHVQSQAESGPDQRVGRVVGTSIA